MTTQAVQPDLPPVAAQTGGRPTIHLLWSNVLMMAFFHAMAALAIMYMVWVQFSWWTLGLGVLWWWLCGFAITGGYHRLFSHPTYRCGPGLTLFHLLFGAAAVQNSALAWSSDHRMHHKFVDHDEDPYNIKQGFWWAHIGWVFFSARYPHDYRNVKDLTASRLLEWQERHYVALALTMGILAPTAIGLLWDDPVGCLLTAGFLRLVVLYHMTFSINSVAHMLGHRPYSIDNTARDSVITAFLTLGEGYHNYHHRFQIDYRNGVRFYHFDPTKWALWAFAKLGIVHDLRRVPREEIERVREAVREQKAARAAARKANVEGP